MTRTGEPWDTLGIAPTKDQTEIRRAYARKLKLTNPEDDPDGFQHLRQMYEQAQQTAALKGFKPRTAIVAEQLEETVQASPPPAVTEKPAAPVVAEDSGERALEAAIAALGKELRSRRPLSDERAKELLTAVFACELDRFDLLQRAESELLDLLSQKIPRSDSMLEKADARFEWTKRREERSLPPQAHKILARIADRDFLKSLDERATEASKAFARLKAPVDRRQRFRRAYLFHAYRWPEIDLIQKLQQEHPRVLSELPPENVEWWRQFAARPHFSLATFGFALLPALFIAIVVRDWILGEGKGRAVPGLVLLGSVAIALGVALFRLYALEWPVLLVQRRWTWQKPRWFETGWLPAVLLLMFVSIPVAGVPWVAWAVAILGGLAAWWAAIAAGPVIPLFASGEEVSIDNSRVLRIGQANLASGFWFIMMLVEYPGNFTLPLGLTVAAAMCAGGVTRSVQVRAFSNYLTSTQQHVYCAALLVLAILLAFLAVSFGNRVEWQVPLFVAVMTLVFLRRPIVGTYPFPSIDIRLIGFGAFAAYQVFRIFTPGAVESSFEQASAKTFFIGALFMLTGIVITTIHWLVSSLNQDRAVR